ncbi:MAG: hypothetical protein ACKO2P_06830, partial [Planctomycetota bacterium]
MQSNPDRIRRWQVAAALIVLSCAAAGAEHLGALKTLRPPLLDLFSPGRLLVLAVAPLERVGPAAVGAAGDRRHNSQPDVPGVSGSAAAGTRELLLRQLLIENARLRRDLQRERQRLAPLLPAAETEDLADRPPLVDLRVVPARVLTRQDTFPDVLRELAIDAGRAQGLNRSELV